MTDTRTYDGTPDPELEAWLGDSFRAWTDGHLIIHSPEGVYVLDPGDRITRSRTDALILTRSSDGHV